MFFLIYSGASLPNWTFLVFSMGSRYVPSLTSQYSRDVSRRRALLGNNKIAIDAVDDDFVVNKAAPDSEAEDGGLFCSNALGAIYSLL